MTGDDIIALAQLHFGESGGGTLTGPNFQDFLNAAIQELYNLMPNDAMKEQIQEALVSVNTSGIGDIPGTVERILGVKDLTSASSLLMQVSPEMIRAIDASDYNKPGHSTHAVFAIMRDKLYIRPKPTVTQNFPVVHISPPAPITNFTLEVTALSAQYHQALAYLVASYAYAQEEDVQQGDYYRSNALQQAGITEERGGGSAGEVPEATEEVG